MPTPDLKVIDLTTVSRTVTYKELIDYCIKYYPDATAMSIYWVAKFYPKNARFFRLPETNNLALLYNAFANYKEEQRNDNNQSRTHRD